MPSRKNATQYAELAGLALFLAVLGYLFFTTTPEQALQTVTLRSAPPDEQTSAAADLSSSGETSPPARSADAEPEPSARDDFGLVAEAFQVTKANVGDGQTFADLLTEAGVPYAQVVALAEKARPTFDVRHLRAGKRYRLYRDSTGGLRHFVYQRGPERYVTFGLGDSLTVRAGKRPVTTVRRTASGTIKRSLYDALDRADADPSLALRLSQVYAWQIDFFRVRPGDRFRVIYEEERVGGEAIGVGRIIGARFDHRGDSYYGLYFPAEEEYFDDEGESLRKSLLQTPLEFARISSRFQKKRFHPVQKRWKAHRGTDYAAEKGTPVYSVGDGRVVEAGYDRTNGNWVKIRHNDTYTTGYLHFSKIADGIEPGERVEQKEVIGYVGETGLATGPHVHYCFWKNGTLVNHYDEEMPSAPPVADSLQGRYDQLKNELLPKLRPTTEGPPVASASAAASPGARGGDASASGR
jgi:murein DD-endopeptidase MepM/ murein hydrolase activator NlpD